MKTTILLLVFGSALFSINSYAQEKQTSTPSTKSIELKITGMSCAGCSKTLSNVLTEIPGVTENEVKYPGDIAVIKYDDNKVKPADIIASIKENTVFTAEIIDKKNPVKRKI